MAGNDREGGALAAEVAELEALLSQVSTAGNRRDLQQLLDCKKAALELQNKAESPEDVPMEPVTEEQHVTLPQPTPVKVGVHHVNDQQFDDVTSFTEISRFGWEDEGYGKDKVSVYIMSGVDGVGDLPKEQVVCNFTKSSFDLKIIGLHGKNYRLVKHHLDKEIDPKKSTFRVKKNRVTLNLWKKEKNESWLNLTAKNPNKASTSSIKDDPATGLMDMMKNMYEEGDDDMKRTIAKAWTESREKQGMPGLNRENEMASTSFCCAFSLNRDDWFFCRKRLMVRSSLSILPIARAASAVAARQDEDLYGDLDTSVDALAKKEVAAQKQQAEAENRRLRHELAQLQQQNRVLGEQNQTLSRNISQLFVTAQHELKRKENEIQRLRHQVQQLEQDRANGSGSGRHSARTPPPVADSERRYAPLRRSRSPPPPPLRDSRGHRHHH
ncbi:TPA: LOW QUALITY PROTEIN: hypothetical protein N0F65_008991 [Lagenidium giganteum]|uniref:Calcyclin-binding protein n=1 Tax=Lagenidium giganteum TaxID=4803 RepID=A0AAV2YS14_9STRA|nr:TPA: LOW QUALITY PROTEIN: hypothetical protein N0F65_008991 [Lagenidium giganteum]